MKRALVLGISGQDGAYLTELLLSKGYEVTGTSRDAQASGFSNLKKLGLYDRVKLMSMALNDFRSVLHVINKVEPTEIYNLSGQSSVGLSFEQPVETMESIALGTLNVLEAMRFLSKDIRLYTAGSSECFGDAGDEPATEVTPFRPRSPYAVAKAAAFGLVSNYRDAYDMFACTGILYNHESPLRAERFVTQKIVRAAARIAAGSNEQLRLGNINIQRDWGWAPDYVDAMWRMLQQKSPDDFVVATGKTVSLEYFIGSAFSYFSLDWRQHVSADPEMLRPSDIKTGAASPEKAYRLLDWRHSKNVEDVVALMCAAAELEKGCRPCLTGSPDH